MVETFNWLNSVIHGSEKFKYFKLKSIEQRTDVQIFALQVYATLPS